MTNEVLYVALVACLIALGFALLYARLVLLVPSGDVRMVGISLAIRQGAMSFLGREYMWVAILVAVLAVVIGFLLPTGWIGAFGFVFGAAISSVAGWIGLRVATGANARTAEAARVGGATRALTLAFRGGAVVGLVVAGLGLLGLVTSYVVGNVLMERADWPAIVACVGFGASVVALVARIGGGIFTKAADVGADLVGEIEEGVPDNDLRNPAVIANNVGDNIGDIAGMGADLIDSYLGSMIAPMVYAALAFAGTSFVLPAIAFPFAVASLGMLASVAASFVVAPWTNKIWGDNPGNSLRAAILVAAALTAMGTFPLTNWIFDDAEVEHPMGLYLAIVVGLLVGLAVGQIAEWFTSDHFKVVKEVARNAQTGPGTVLISGIAEGMRSSAYSVLVVVAGIVGSYAAGNWASGDAGGVYGLAVAGVGLLATLAITFSVYAHGPIADNASAIAQLADLPPEAREATNALDALGNTTAAVAKGFAIGAAAVTALALFAAFAQTVSLDSVNLINPATTAGLFVGAMFPFLLSSFTMNAVGRAAKKVVEEVRRQFREIPGLSEGRSGVESDSARCVDVAAAGALREIIVPGVLTIAAPIAIGLLSVEALGAFLAGALVTGFLLAIFMANSGGAWDNAKKFIEAGAFGGGGSDAHKAAVVGDTVGDPFKDTSGPSINVAIKLMTIVSLVFASLFVG